MRGWVGGLIIAAALLLVLGAVVYGVTRNATAQAEQREAAISSCHLVGDPLRHAVIALWEDKITSTEGLKPSDFPGFGPHRFHAQIRKTRRKAERHVKKLRAAPSCEERF